MVRQSTVDYEGWKQDVKDIYTKKFPKKIKGVNKFIDYTSKVLDKHQRTFIPYQILLYLFGKRNWLRKNNQHIWIAFIGRKGGEGKSTLAQQILYYMDNTFNPKRIKLDYDTFIRCIPIAKKEDDFPSILLDEPENKTHVLSGKGRQVKDILERVRQLNLTVGVCANSLTSVPGFIYDRINVIIYLDNFKFWVWDNTKDKPKYTVIDDIKRDFTRKGKGHAVFKDKHIINRAIFKNQGFTKELPFDQKDYLKSKQSDIIAEIERYNNNGKSPKKDVTRAESIEWMIKNTDLTDVQIAKTHNCTYQNINKTRKKLSTLNRAERDTTMSG